SIYAGESVVINKSISERIEKETDSYKGFEFAKLPSDPIKQDFSLAELVGTDLHQSLEAVTRLQSRYLEYSNSLNIRRSELETLKTLESEGDREIEILSEQIRQVEELLPKVSPIVQSLPYWWADALDIQQKMADRNSILQSKIHEGQR